MEDVRFVDTVLLPPVFHAQTVAVNPSPKEYTTHVMYAMGVESLKTDMEIGLSVLHVTVKANTGSTSQKPKHVPSAMVRESFLEKITTGLNVLHAMGGERIQVMNMISFQPVFNQAHKAQMTITNIH